MALKLRVISDQYKQLGRASSQLFETGGGTIGRAPDNDWILPDPDRYVSSHHARISFRGGTWLLEDLSTNGVFVNDSDTPLSVTGPRKLKEGDRLRLGDYDIVVTIDDPADTGRHSSKNQGRRGSTREDHADYLRHGSFRNHDNVSSREQMGDDLGEDLDITGLLSRGSKADSGADDAIAAFDRASEESGIFALNSRKPAAPDYDYAQKADQPASRGVKKPIGGTSLLDNILEVDGPVEEVDDWHMSTRRLTPHKPTPVAQPTPKPVARPHVAPTLDSPVVRETAAREQAARADSGSIDQQLADRPRRAARHGAQTEARAERRAPAESGVDLHGGIEALCRGAGIDPIAVPSDAHATLLMLAGQMLREVVLDLMEALRNRGEHRSHMEIEQTMMQPIQNNPLKFATSVEDALRRLLDSNSTRYMAAVDSLREAFTDLKNHQQGVEAATLAALDDVLKRVDPSDLQERFDRSIKRNPAAVAAGKAKYWELYTEFFQLLNQRDARGWPAVSSTEFSRAYTAKLEELEKKRHY